MGNERFYSIFFCVCRTILPPASSCRHANTATNPMNESNRHRLRLCRPYAASATLQLMRPAVHLPFLLLSLSLSRLENKIASLTAVGQMRGKIAVPQPTDIFTLNVLFHSLYLACSHFRVSVFFADEGITQRKGFRTGNSTIWTWCTTYQGVIRGLFNSARCRSTFRPDLSVMPPNIACSGSDQTRVEPKRAVQTLTVCECPRNQPVLQLRKSSILSLPHRSSHLCAPNLVI